MFCIYLFFFLFIFSLTTIYQWDDLWSNLFCCMNLSVPDPCPPNYSGSNCAIKRYCETNDTIAGCLNSQCFQGYWGQQCDMECRCDDCVKLGCNGTQCFSGYWASDCETECHCLTGAACDQYTGQCDADVTTSLRLCEPGYVSNTGINLDNCQQGTRSISLRYAHYYPNAAFNVELIVG